MANYSKTAKERSFLRCQKPAEAVRSARELMAARMAAGKMPDGHTRFEIVDDSGKTVLVIPFEEAIDRS
jgi:hypothetical protein